MATILIVEDEESVRAFLERALSEAGHQIVSAKDGSDALLCLEQARAQGRKFDLMLSDIVMPILDGIGLALRVARDSPELKILLMTGYVHQKERAHQLETLIEDVLFKPFSLEDLLRAVNQALGK